MDIDETEDITTNNDIEDVTMDVDGEKVESVEEPHQEEDGLLSLLSPTMLGAKLAIKKPLLLMPPPPPAQPTPINEPQSPEIDYEYDISAFKPIRSEGVITQRTNSTSFQPKNINSFLSNNQHEYLDNNYRQESQPVTIHNHHHHYYYYNNDQRNENTNNNIKSSNLQLENLLDQKKKLQLEQYKQQLEQHQFYLEQYQRNDHLILPSPWKRNISPIERIPYMLMSYLQLIVNFVASLYGIYLVYYLFSTINMDIKTKISQQQTNLMINIESCRQAYYQNGCDDKENLVPLLISKCQKYERCMKQDPYKLSNVSIMSAETIGMILNSLIEPLSVKFYLFVFAFVVVVFACNFTFGYIRAKAYYGDEKLFKVE
ncbi:BRL1 Nucleus export protein BRL1 [Candida maltosa Xu316]